MEHRITEAHPLLNERGELVEAGYATGLLPRYSRADIKAGASRIKEWDYYAILGDRFGFCVTVADNSYMGLDSVTLLDFEKGTEITKSYMRAFPNGSTGLPSSSACGTTKISRKGYDIAFLHEKGETHAGSGQRIIRVKLHEFTKDKPLEAKLVLSDEPEDSMVIATPFAGHPKHFYFNQKINCQRARGVVRYDGREYAFDGRDTFAVLDWGRGVWTYSNTWYWASASGLEEGKPFGFNLGYGFGDTGAASENTLFFDGHAHKLEHSDFGIPQKDGRDDFLSPWHFTSRDGRLDLVFTPILDRHSDTNALIIRSNQHQVFGRYSGRVLLDGGTPVEVKDLLGFAEKVANKW